MATFTITIPDQYVPRVREAFGWYVGDPLVFPGPLATAAQIEAAILAHAKGITLMYEDKKRQAEAAQAAAPLPL